jgi:small subunit ribosomal protein S16
MSVVIRMMRAGAKKRPFYRMVAADSRRQRDGRFLEILGHYDPLADPYELVVHREKVENWLSRGAQPSTQAASLLRTLGIGARVSVAAEAGAAAPPAKAKKAEAKARTRRAPRKLSERKTKKKAAKRAAKKAAKA